MLYVQNENKMVYKVEMKPQQASEFYYHLHLELVAGWDYVNPDENDIQGYVGADRFIEDVQLEILTFYPINESIIERLEDEDYKRVNINELQIEHILNSI